LFILFSSLYRIVISNVFSLSNWLDSVKFPQRGGWR